MGKRLMNALRTLQQRRRVMMMDTERKQRDRQEAAELTSRMIDLSGYVPSVPE